MVLGAEKIPRVAVSYGINGFVATSIPPEGSSTQILREVSFEHFTADPVFSNFISASAEAFVDTQEECKILGDYEHPQTVLSTLSWSYRALILDLIKTLEKNKREEEGMLYSHLDFVWHFCDIMFISAHPELPILPYLSDWMDVNFDKSEDILEEIFGSELERELTSNNRDAIREIIFVNTIQGRTTEASRLLKFINSDEEQTELLGELMLKRPSFIPGLSSMTEFETAIQLWKDECENRYALGAFDRNEDFTLLAQILCGRPEGLQGAQKFMTTWYEYLAMMVNYQYPFAKASRLGEYAKKAIEVFGSVSAGSRQAEMEKIILAAMEFNIVVVIREMQMLWNNPWFALHFCDLVHNGRSACNLSQDAAIDYMVVTRIRDELIREYGMDLMLNHSTWQIGVKYLEQLPKRGGWPIIGELLPRVKVTSDAEIEKVIRLAEKFDLAQEVKSICREAALRKMAQNRFQCALLWALRAGDESFTSFIVDKLLEAGDIDMVPSLVDSLPNFAASGEKLLFLDLFSKFQRFAIEKDFMEASASLCKLIDYKLIPTRFAAKVLEYLQAFSDNHVRLQPQQVSVVIQYVHEVGEKTLGREAFKKINKMLIRHRSSELFSRFQEMNGKVKVDVL